MVSFFAIGGVCIERIYYVYEWYFVDTGRVFYVGKGKGRRYREKKDRNEKFIKYISKFDCQSRIVIQKLDESKAYEKEKELISYYKENGDCSCNFTIGGDAPPVHFGADAPNRREVVQLTLSGEYVKTWDYIQEIEKSLGLNNSAIVGCCKRKRGRRSVGGFIWVYKEEYQPNTTYLYRRGTNAKKILQYNIDGSFIREWESAKSISEKLGLRRSGICCCLKGQYKTCGGYKWLYKIDSKLYKTS